MEIPRSGPVPDSAVPADALDRLPVDFTAFYCEEHPGYLRYARQRLRHHEDAEDAVQNAGAVLYRNWRRALSSANLEAFAFKILKDAVADIMRERRRTERKRLRVIAQRDPDTSQNEFDELAELDILDRAMEDLGRAAPIQADVVRLRQAGRSYPEIGNALGIAHTTARTYYSLGRRHLEYLVEQAGLEPDDRPGARGAAVPGPASSSCGRGEGGPTEAGPGPGGGGPGGVHPGGSGGVGGVGRCGGTDEEEHRG
ncbi:RNA polymerase sigma factor [Kitasatospora sp. NPDC004240]